MVQKEITQRKGNKTSLIRHLNKKGSQKNQCHLVKTLAETQKRGRDGSIPKIV